MNKLHNLQEYVYKEKGITISKKLIAFILNPQKLNSLNNTALKEIVIEFAPVYKAFRWTLDGPSVLNQLASFTILLECRLSHKPELQKILDEGDYTNIKKS